MERCTQEIAPDTPEQLLFTVDECRLATSAVNNYVLSRIVGTQQSRADRTFKAMMRPADSQMAVDGIMHALQQAHTLVAKLTNANHAPVSLAPIEIQHLGAALFYAGNKGGARAYAIALHEIGFFKTSEKQQALLTITSITPQAFALFEELTPIAVSKKPSLEWPAWSTVDQYINQLREQEVRKAIARRTTPK